mgnify:CR=1 FL=1
MESVPVVIAHFGSSYKYVRIALQSAEDYNDKAVLLGDDTNIDLWKNHWNVSERNVEKFDLFLNTYTKLTDYPELYEKSFWRRMFVLEEWMKQEGQNEAILLDSDVFTFSNYTEELLPKLSDNCKAGLMTPTEQKNYRWAASCHFSYWTLEAITDFTDFCIKMYREPSGFEKLKEKREWHLNNNKSGGVTEMTLLYLWSKDRNDIDIISKDLSGVTCDHHIKRAENYYPDEYEKIMGFKKLKFIDGKPYGFNKELKKKVRFLGLHCQGGAKDLMSHFSKGNFINYYYLVPYLMKYIRVKNRIQYELKNLFTF